MMHITLTIIAQWVTETRDHITRFYMVIVMTMGLVLMGSTCLSLHCYCCSDNERHTRTFPLPIQEEILHLSSMRVCVCVCALVQPFCFLLR